MTCLWCGPPWGSCAAVLCRAGMLVSSCLVGCFVVWSRCLLSCVVACCPSFFALCTPCMPRCSVWCCASLLPVVCSVLLCRAVLVWRCLVRRSAAPCRAMLLRCFVERCSALCGFARCFAVPVCGGLGHFLLLCASLCCVVWCILLRCFCCSLPRLLSWRGVFWFGAVVTCGTASGLLCCSSLCCVRWRVSCGAVLCCPGVRASCRPVLCSAVVWSLVGAWCGCMFLGVRWWAWLPGVVFWWCVSVPVSVSRRVARCPVARRLHVVPCGVLLLCVVSCGAVLLCGALLWCPAVFFALLVALVFSVPVKIPCETRKNGFLFSKMNEN